MEMVMVKLLQEIWVYYNESIKELFVEAPKRFDYKI